ncbi:unnamed protein product [Closterium sp. NIES-64]|nr:unnamed protein product [Closterium sp. NIES-64]
MGATGFERLKYDVSKKESDDRSEFLKMFCDPNSSAADQHEDNARGYGSSWPLLCCALASKRLLEHVLSFVPISLVYENERWQKTIRYFLTHHGQRITSLHLIFTEMDQLPSLRPLIARCSSALSSFSLKWRGFVSMFEEHEYKDWTLSFLQDCLQLQRLKLGRGMWNLDKGCANAAWLKSIHCLTLKQVDMSHVNFEYLECITPQLHEFTLYQHWHLSRWPVFGSHAMTFSFPNARLLRFRFANNEFKLTLSVSSALKTLSVMASLASPLLHEQRSSRTRPPLTIRPGMSCHFLPPPRICASRVPQRLGIVMHAEGPHNKEWEATVENYRAFMEDREFDDDLDEDGGWGGCYGDDDDEDEDDEDEDMGDGSDDDEEYGGRGYGGGRGGSRKKKAPAKPPSIGAPNVRYLFFPSRKACDAATLAALRQDYPALVLYCVVDRSYWERKGEMVNNAPLKHVRQAKSGVLRDKFDDKKQPKNVREKMYSVNRKLVEGYSADEDEAHMFKYKGRF